MIALASIAQLMQDRRTVALSGAGISTESGIPDYRGPQSGARRAQPISYREFVTDPSRRARYWARSAVGWPRVTGARPNSGHAALADMERARVRQRRHHAERGRAPQAAGSRTVVELHGTLSKVVCLQCAERERRQDLQERILASNPGWAAGAFREAAALPDGDASIDAPPTFRIPECLRCGGMLKPDVVFFGENVPRPGGAGPGHARGGRGPSRSRLLPCRVFGVPLRRSSLRGIQACRHHQPRPLPRDALAAVHVEAALGQALPRLASMLAAGVHLTPRGRRVE